MTGTGLPPPEWAHHPAHSAPRGACCGCGAAAALIEAELPGARQLCGACATREWLHD